MWNLLLLPQRQGVLRYALHSCTQQTAFCHEEATVITDHTPWGRCIYNFHTLRKAVSIDRQMVSADCVHGHPRRHRWSVSACHWGVHAVQIVGLAACFYSIEAGASTGSGDLFYITYMNLYLFAYWLLRQSQCCTWHIRASPQIVKVLTLTSTWTCKYV